MGDTPALRPTNRLDAERHQHATHPQLPRVHGRTIGRHAASPAPAAQLLRPPSARRFVCWVLEALEPPFLYVYCSSCIAPLRLYFPRPAALFATFLVSGFVLHDIPFGNRIDIFRGRPEVPQVTLLLGIFGLLALVTAALRIDLSPQPSWFGRLPIRCYSRSASEYRRQSWPCWGADNQAA
jgi:hypothetical protein